MDQSHYLEVICDVFVCYDWEKNEAFFETSTSPTETQELIKKYNSEDSHVEIDAIVKHWIILKDGKVDKVDRVLVSREDLEVVLR